MNWLKDYVRPKIQSWVAPKEIPDNLWVKCPKCERMIFAKELDKNLKICVHCNHHMRLDPNARFESLFDKNSYSMLELPKVPDDPLGFKDSKNYSERLKEYRKKTGNNDAIQVAHGTMGGMPIVIACFDFRFMGGSMGTAVGEGIIAAAELAILQQASLIIFTASGGARMQEGILSLMQMARTTLAVKQLKESGNLFINVFTDPTTGGVSASFAMLGDIAISEPDAIIGFAGARVIEHTIRENLPEGFQKAEYLYNHGFVDMVVDRRNLRSEIIKSISILKKVNLKNDATLSKGER
ncbi:MAG: Acetyl-coenzyme A carboxylase carboxyl transferase subunit beta [Alphaproteobacteria bacterium ADurb.Bin438]|nr:MAG: Acetyl-coenzyme A carboxylase carboxyl transferase subunit beta [Alphaproteobacteria bacterium ADurb.Bin438]